MINKKGQFIKGQSPWNKGTKGLMNIWNKGKVGVYSEEVRDKMSIAKRGKKYSEETLRKMSEAQKGRKHSEETKKKLREINRGEGNPNFGKVPSAESIEKQKISRAGYKHSEETKRKMSELKKGKPNLFFRGENNPNWKGGITPVNKQIRHSLEYKLWREAVFTRDDWACIWCGARSNKDGRVTLHADHIKTFAHYPELRFAIDNGRTLCEPCHKTTDTYKVKGTGGNKS